MKTKLFHRAKTVQPYNQLNCFVTKCELNTPINRLYKASGSQLTDSILSFHLFSAGSASAVSGWVTTNFGCTVSVRKKEKRKRKEQTWVPIHQNIQKQKTKADMQAAYTCVSKKQKCKHNYCYMTVCKIDNRFAYKTITLFDNSSFWKVDMLNK